MKNVSREPILTLPVPVTSATEQSRIVRRVAEFGALCADYLQYLSATWQTQSQLAEALVETV